MASLRSKWAARWESGSAGRRIGVLAYRRPEIAQPPDGNASQVITPISAEHALALGSEAQDITVHSATNELSLRLPAAGDGV